MGKWLNFCLILRFWKHPFAEKKRGVKGGPSLPCSVRYKVAVGIAEAIGYLHNGTERCVVHRDIKPSNILLSSKKTPKVIGPSIRICYVVVVM